MSNEPMILGRLPVFDDRLFHTANARGCTRGWVKFIHHEGPGEVRVRCANGAVPIVKIENLQWEAMTEQQELEELYAELADGNKLARRALCHIKAQQSKMEEMRALLAKPADTVLGFKVVEDASMAPNTMRLVQPAAQPQGEPVAWQFYHDGKWWNGDDRIRDHRKNTEEAGYKVRDLFAEQPAPVAVVLPERNKASQNLDLEQCGYVDGWNACLDEAARLNLGAKPCKT